MLMLSGKSTSCHLCWSTVGVAGSRPRKSSVGRMHKCLSSSNCDGVITSVFQSRNQSVSPYLLSPLFFAPVFAFFDTICCLPFLSVVSKLWFEIYALGFFQFSNHMALHHCSYCTKHYMLNCRHQILYLIFFSRLLYNICTAATASIPPELTVIFLACIFVFCHPLLRLYIYIFLGAHFTVLADCLVIQH